MPEKIFRDLSAPVNLQWEVTPGCNYCCVHCYNFWREKKWGVGAKALEPSTELLEKVTDEIIKNSILEVVITGGEPLMVLDKIYPFLLRLKKAGIRLALNTNASLITPGVMKKIIRAGISSLLVSLPSSDESINDEITQAKNSVRRTTSGIKNAIAGGITPMVNMVISQKNLSSIYDTAKYLKSIGVNHIGVSKAAVPHNSIEFKKQALDKQLINKMILEIAKARSELGVEIDSLIPLPACFSDDPDINESLNYFRINCMAGKTTCVIGYDGQIRACLHISKSYGSIRSGLKAAWKKMSEWRTDQWIPEKCSNCAIKESCGGGCKAEVLAYGGKMEDPDPLANFKELTHGSVLGDDVPQVDENDMYLASSHLFGRKERFGGIFAVDGKSILLNKKLFKFIATKFNKHQTFTFVDICHILDVGSNQGHETVAYLLNNKVIQVCQRKS